MSEEDYLNISDIQLLRAAKVMLNNVMASNCANNYERICIVRNNIHAMIKELEPKITTLLESE